MSKIKMNLDVDEYLSGRIPMIGDIALNRFVYN